jgi:regulatory protein YycI of two-component signal transduction system YycFG
MFFFLIIVFLILILILIGWIWVVWKKVKGDPEEHRADNLERSAKQPTALKKTSTAKRELPSLVPLEKSRVKISKKKANTNNL